MKRSRTGSIKSGWYYIYALLFIVLLMGLVFDYSAPETVSASIIDKIELTDQRTRTSKTYSLGETPEGNQRYALEASIGSIHYREGGQWLEIDSAIVESQKVGWDWEVEKGHWKLLIKDDTSVAVGKDGHWLGFRYEGFAYLDKSTDEYVILENRRQVTPTVEGNKIRWEGIFYGVNLEYIYGNDRFKENLEITQTARDWLSANPPSSYGLDNQTTYLVGYIQCDWRYSYEAKDADGNSINWTNANEFQETPINFWHPVKNYIVSALPVDYAYHLTDLEFEPLKLRKRFIRAPDDNYYLLFGASVLDLNQFPSGTIVFDPTIDVSVAASLDDVNENEGTGTVLNNNEYVYNYSVNGAQASTEWGGYRFILGDTIDPGDTIDVAIFKINTHDTDRDTAYFYIHFEDAASPVQFAVVADNVTDRARTTASVLWDEADLGNGQHNSPSVVTPLQELVDAFSVSTVVVITRPVWTATGLCRADSSEYDGGSGAAEIYIEFTAGGGASAPTVVTNAATSVEETTATLSGNITATGGENSTDRGFYWDTDSGNPYANNWFEQGNFGVAQFTHGITSLTEGELYYAIASANNSGGTGNGTEVQFLTKPDEPTSFTATSQNSTRISFSWANGDGRDTTLLRYNATGYPPDPASGNLSYNSTATTHDVTGLTPGTQIWAHIRSWAAEGGLEQYSDLTDNVTDYTLPGNPGGGATGNETATTIDIAWVKGTGGDYTMVRRQTGSYPDSPASGTQAYYDTGSNFTDTSLPKGTAQFYAIYARDSDSNYYSALSENVTATTNVTAPTVINVAASNIASTTARINGNLTDDGGESCNVTMFWGTTDGSDNISAWEHEVDKGSRTTGTFFENLTSLNVTTQYFFNSRAINTEGTDWADSTANFTTLAAGEAPAVTLIAPFVFEAATPMQLVIILSLLTVFSALAFWKENAIIFMLAGGTSLFTGLFWYDVYNINAGLGMSLMFIAYSLLCLGLAFRCIFWREDVLE